MGSSSKKSSKKDSKKDKKKKSKAVKKKDKKREASSSGRHKQHKHAKERKRSEPTIPVETQRKALLKVVSSHPTVVTELVLVLRALEAGQGVALDGLPNPEIRKRMTALLDTMPRLRTEVAGLSASTTYFLTDDDSGDSHDPSPLLRACLQAVGELIGPPLDVSHAQDRVDALLSSFPALKDDLPGLLQRVATGEAVVIGGLEDKGLKEGLAALLEALALKRAGDEEDEVGYELVKGPAGKDQRERVRELIRLNNGGDVEGEEDGEAIDDDDDEEGGEGAEGMDVSTDAAAAAADADPDAPPFHSTDGDPSTGRRVIGPAIPDAALLAQAQALKEQQALDGPGSDEDEGGGAEDDDDDDDDVVGPSLGDGRAAVPDAIAYRHLARAQAAKEAKEAGGGMEEDWLAQAMGAQTKANLAPGMKNRSFTQRSRRAQEANPSGTSGPSTAAHFRELEADQEARSKRKTMLEVHQDKLKGARDATRGKKLERKPWSRDEFIEGQKEMGSKQAHDLFQHAKELGTRFSRTFR